MAAQPLYTVEEYLAFERANDERHEYIDGLIYPVGECPTQPDVLGNHADISANLVGLIHEQLRDSPCRVRTKDTKVRSGPTQRRMMKGLFSYPDVVVICGEPQYHDEHRDVVINPAVIIEVLSESTEARSRGKVSSLPDLEPALTDYVLVSQIAPIIEHFERRPDGSWSYHVYDKIEESFTVKSINCTLKLSDVYARIVFPEESDEE